MYQWIPSAASELPYAGQGAMLRFALIALAIAALAFSVSQSTAQAAAPDAPGAVTNLSLKPGVERMTVSWTAPDPASTGRYVIKVYTGSTATGTPVLTRYAQSDKTERTFDGLTGGTQYTVSVQAQNKNNDGKTAGTAVTQTATTLAAAATPGAVTNLSLKPGVERMTVSWTAPDPAPTGRYVIDVYEGSTASGAVVLTRYAQSDKTERKFAGLTGGTQYTVSVKAQNVSGETKATGTAVTQSATTLAAAATPGAVTDLALKPGAERMTVSWTAPDPAPTGKYIIKVYTGSTATGTPVLTKYATSDKTERTFGGLTRSTEYTISVQAQNVSGETKAVGSAATATATTK